MKNKIDNYLESVLGQIKFSEAHPEIKRELLTHVEEIKDATTGFELTNERVEDEIIRRLGPAHDLGEKLNQVHKPSIEWSLLGFVSILLAIGLFLMFQVERGSQQLLWFVIGLIPLIGFMFAKPKHLQKSSVWIYVATIALGVFSVFSGLNVDGQPYLVIGPLNIKIVDLSVVLFVISLAGFLPQVRQSIPRKILFTLASTVPLLGYLLIGSVYPALLLFVAVLAMIIRSSASAGFTLSFAGIGGLLLSVFIKNQQFVSAERFASVVETEKHTDFIFTFLRAYSASLSIIVVIVSLSAIAYFMNISKKVKSVYGSALMTGIICLFSMSTAWGLFSNFGFLPMPITGVNFPFLSYGGSLLVAHMGLVGIMIGILRRKNITVYE